MNFYNYYRDEKNDRLKEIHKEKYNYFFEKLQKYFQEQKYEDFLELDWSKIQRKNTVNYNEATLVYFGLKEYIEEKKDIKNLIDIIQKITEFLQEGESNRER